MISEAKRKENRILAMQYFTGKGFSDVVAAGIVGNLMVESGMDPSIKEYGGGAGIGLAQWTHRSRKDGLKAFVEEQGLSWEDLLNPQHSLRSFDLQLQFIWHELRLPEYANLFRKLVNTETAYDATALICLKYERPGKPNFSARVRYADAALKEWREAREERGGRRTMAGSPSVACGEA